MFIDPLLVKANGTELLVRLRDLSPGKTVRVSGDTTCTISHTVTGSGDAKVRRGVFRLDVLVPATTTVPSHTLSCYIVSVTPLLASPAAMENMISGLIATISGDTPQDALSAPEFRIARFVDGEP